MHNVDAVVIGGGVVGLAGALLYAKHGHHVVLLDKNAPLANTSVPERWYAINRASQRLLENLGAWSYIEQNNVSPYVGMHVWDAQSQAQIEFDSRMLGREKLGDFIEESVLVNALREAAKAQECVDLQTEQTIISIHPTANGREIQTTEHGIICRQLMVADGARSESRAKLGVGMHSWSYGHDALVCKVKTQNPHRHKAYQVFHPEGPLALLPTDDPHYCSIVWSLPPQRAKDLLLLGTTAFEAALQKAFGHRLGAVALASETTSFPLRMRHTRHYAGDNWLLAGDAAHTVHPLAGLGLNIGLADIATLECIMAENKGALATNRQLKAYQRTRKARVWQTILVLEAIKRSFGNSNSLLSRVRGAVMGQMNGFLPLKRWFIEQADGFHL